MSSPLPSKAGLDIVRKYASDMSTSAGVYRMLNAKGEVIYVGKARNLKNRVASYVNVAQLPNRLRRMVFNTASMEIITTASEAEALLVESTLIKKYQPRYNILLKDDKSFPYILFSKDHAFPRISKHRGTPTNRGDYLGPFVSASAVNETITLLQRAFLLRQCPDSIFKNRSRPCLQYQIKRCSAPCVGYVTEEEYATLVADAKAFLSGHSREIQEKLTNVMELLSNQMEFEKAALMRDRIRALNFVQEQQTQAAADLADADVMALIRESKHACVQVFSFRGGRNFGNQSFFPAHAEEAGDAEVLEAFIGQYYELQPVPKLILTNLALEGNALMEEALSLKSGRKVEICVPMRGDKRKVLEQVIENTKGALKRHLSSHQVQRELLEGVALNFGLSAPPERIEVYDNSHISGTNAVGAMIVAGQEGFNKKAYRKFTIKNTELTPGDDYAMLREVLTRRFRRLLEEPDEEGPDLVLIDGGPGQFSVASDVFAGLGLSGFCYVCIAKGPDRNAGREWFYMPNREPFQLPVGDPTLHYLERLRDEAHRFAIGFHRDKRSKEMRRSELDSIPLIGGKRKKALLLHFGSARAVAGASIDDIARVPGISKEIAQKIYAFFH